MRERAIALLEAVEEIGIDNGKMLDYIICNYLTGDQAEEVMKSIIEEFDIENEVKEILGEDESEEDEL